MRTIITTAFVYFARANATEGCRAVAVMLALLMTSVAVPLSGCMETRSTRAARLAINAALAAARTTDAERTATTALLQMRTQRAQLQQVAGRKA